MNEKKYIIYLWIQNVPKSLHTVLSKNGKELKPASSEYLDGFSFLNTINSESLKALTPTLNVKKVFHIFKPDDYKIYISGYFQEKDDHDRNICYRALIVSNVYIGNEKVCKILQEEAALYGCSISSEDVRALKKKITNTY